MLQLPAQAGRLVVESHVPVEIHVDQIPLVRLYTAGQASVVVPQGEHTLSVYRGASPEVLVAGFPAQGDVTLLVGPSSLSLIDPIVAPPHQATEAPVVELRAPSGPGATIIVGSKRLVLVAGQPVTLAGLEPGTLPLEVRSVDGSVIWARGELELAAGDHIVLVVPEGRPLEVFGRPEAWVPGS